MDAGQARHTFLACCCSVLDSENIKSVRPTHGVGYRISDRCAFMMPSGILNLCLPSLRRPLGMFQSLHLRLFGSGSPSMSRVGATSKGCEGWPDPVLRYTALYG